MCQEEGFSGKVVNTPFVQQAHQSVSEGRGFEVMKEHCGASGFAIWCDSDEEMGELCDFLTSPDCTSAVQSIFSSNLETLCEKT